MFPHTQDLPSATVVDNTTVQMGKSFLFDFATGDFVINDGRLVVTDNATAIKVWIEKILRTEKGRYAIYEGLSYGTSIEDLIIGTNYNIAFTESELKREIEEALFQHPHISGVSNFVLTREISGITAEFTVVLKDGTTVDSEVSLNGA